MKPEEAFGQILKKIRSERKISQEKLALMGDLDRTYISLLERGLRQPTLTTILNLSKALNVSPEYIMKEVKELLDENIEDDRSD